MKIRNLAQRMFPHAARATWAATEQVVNPLIMIVLTPFMLQQLGEIQFGLWMFATALVGMGQLMSLGAGTATIKHVSADIAIGKTEDAVNAVRAAITMVLMGGAVVCLAISIMGSLIAHTFFSKMGDAALVSMMLTFGVVLMFVQEIDNVLSSALRGAQRFDLSAKFELISRLLLAVGVALLAWYFGTAIAVLSGTLLFLIIKGIIKGYLVNRLLSASNCLKPIFEEKHLKRVADFGKWMWVQNVGGMLFGVADRLLVGGIFGASDLARYSICLQFVQYLHSIPAAAMQVVFPWLSAKIGRGEAIRDLNLPKLAWYGGVACVILPILLFLFAQPLLAMWLGSEFAAYNANLALILIVAYGVLAFNVPAHFFLMGLGAARFLSITNLFAGLVSIMASLILSPFGLTWFAASKVLFGPIILLNFYKLRKSS